MHKYIRVHETDTVLKSLEIFCLVYENVQSFQNGQLSCYSTDGNTRTYVRTTASIKGACPWTLLLRSSLVCVITCVSPIPIPLASPPFQADWDVDHRQLWLCSSAGAAPPIRDPLDC